MVGREAGDVPLSALGLGAERVRTGRRMRIVATVVSHARRRDAPVAVVSSRAVTPIILTTFVIINDK